MPTREYYLRQAQVLFELAAKMSLKPDAERLINRANEYQILAEAMPPDHDPPADHLPMPPPAPQVTITQPMQQQQQQQKKEDEE